MERTIFTPEQVKVLLANAAIQQQKSSPMAAEQNPPSTSEVGRT